MYDAIVIGAGVMGSAAAYNLAKAGASTRWYWNSFPGGIPSAALTEITVSSA